MKKQGHTEFHFSMTLKAGFSRMEESKMLLTAKACVEAGKADASKNAFFKAFREVGGNTCASQVLLTGLRLAKEGKGLEEVTAGLKQAQKDKAEKDKADRAAKKDKAGQDKAEGAEGAEGAVSPISLIDGLDKLNLAALQAYKASLVRALFATRKAIKAKQAEEAKKNAPEVIVATIAAGVHPLTQAEIEAGDKARRLARLERKGILPSQVA